MGAEDPPPVFSEAAAFSSRGPTGAIPGGADPARNPGQSALQANYGPRNPYAALVASGPPVRQSHRSGPWWRSLEHSAADAEELGARL
eukprot:2123421-Pyramimonas_sp.AAC.1